MWQIFDMLKINHFRPKVSMTTFNILKKKMFSCIIMLLLIITKIFQSITVYKMISSSSQPLENCLQQTAQKENPHTDRDLPYIATRR